MEGIVRDLRYAIRSLLGAKKFASIVIATLSLGIGANTAVFAVLNDAVLEPLPYDESDRLVRIYLARADEDMFWPSPAVTELRDRSRTVDIAAVYTYAAEGADLTGRAQPERVQTMRVSADYFRVLRIRPLLGGLFERADERAGARIAVVSERIWREHLDGAADAAGRILSLNGIAYQVAGVLPASFDDPLLPGTDVWTPISLHPTDRGFSWENNFLTVIARLNPGATLEQARAETGALAAGMPWTSRPEVRRSVRLARLQEDTLGSAGPMLWILLGAVALLLLIACVNVASLFLARGMAREAEFAVRAALGSSRWRLTRQLLMESVLLSMAGGVTGLALAVALIRTFAAAAPEQIARVSGGSPEVVVFAFCFGVAVLAGIGFGITPALQFAPRDLEGALRESGRSGSGSRRQTRTRNALVVGQIALALVLLSSAGLLLRSFDRLRGVALGVQPDNVLTFQVNLPAGRYGEAAQRARFHREFQDRIAALPGARAIGAVSRLPVSGSYHSWGTLPDGAAPGTRSVAVEQRVIEGKYFDAVGIPLLRGRPFGDEDTASTPRKVIASRELVRRMFGEEDPIGKRLRVAGDSVEIIGVVADVALSARGMVRPLLYHSHTQFASDRNWALIQVVALERAVPSLLEDARRELAAIDPALVLHQPRMLAEVIGAGIAAERFALRVIAAFALLALTLAAIGVYGVLSYAVTRRRREMGIRMTLGAPHAAVWSLIVRDGGRLAAAGVVLGLFGAFAATRTLRSLLFDVSATDPMVFVAAAATLAGVALAASWIPARAATRVDPLQAVRADG
jgi:putative ABC transport system permease protein